MEKGDDRFENYYPQILAQLQNYESKVDKQVIRKRNLNRIDSVEDLTKLKTGEINTSKPKLDVLETMKTAVNSPFITPAASTRGTNTFNTPLPSAGITRATSMINISEEMSNVTYQGFEDEIKESSQKDVDALIKPVSDIIDSAINTDLMRKDLSQLEMVKNENIDKYVDNFISWWNTDSQSKKFIVIFLICTIFAINSLNGYNPATIYIGPYTGLNQNVGLTYFSEKIESDIRNQVDVIQTLCNQYEYEFDGKSAFLLLLPRFIFIILHRFVTAMLLSTNVLVSDTVRNLFG